MRRPACAPEALRQAGDNFQIVEYEMVPQVHALQVKLRTLKRDRYEIFIRRSIESKSPSTIFYEISHGKREILKPGNLVNSTFRAQEFQTDWLKDDPRFFR
jgi:hypothetical protein